jgi:hypothetical protein
MCRFQTNDDDGFFIVSRRLKLMSLGQQTPSLGSKHIEVKKAKVKVSDILESSQTYNSQFTVPLFIASLGPAHTNAR